MSAGALLRQRLSAAGASASAAAAAATRQLCRRRPLCCAVLRVGHGRADVTRRLHVHTCVRACVSRTRSVAEGLESRTATHSPPPSPALALPRSKITRGMEVLHSLESLPTKREGIFVMPLERITIVNSYWYRKGRPEPALTLPGERRRGERGVALWGPQRGGLRGERGALRVAF